MSISLILTISTVLLVVSVLLAMLRLIKGPTVFDRILCFDGITIGVMGLLVIVSILWNTADYFDLILIYSILGFFGTVAFAFYLYQTYDPADDIKPGESND